MIQRVNYRSQYRDIRDLAFPPSKRSPRGFTLLELVVALSLVSIVAVALFVAVRIAFKARDSAEAAVEPSRTAGLAMDFLKVDLEAAQPPRETLIGSFVGSDSTDTRGRSADSVTFYSTAAGPRHEIGAGEMKRIELGVETTAGAVGGAEEFALVRRVTSNLLSPVFVEPDIEVLCRGVGSFNLEYFDSVTGWLDFWDSTQHDDTLPAAIRVTVELDRPGATVNGVAGEPVLLRYSRVFRIPCAAGPDPDAGVESGATTPSAE